MTKILTPIQDTKFNQDNWFAWLDIALFFQKELRNLSQNLGYTEDEYRMFLSWHQPRDLVEKILDPDRFFRIIRDDTGKIIGYFESRMKDRETEVVQWVLIDASQRRKWHSKKIWEEFFEYCKTQWRVVIFSFAKAQNEASCQMHRSMWFKQIDNQKDGITFRKEFSK